MAEPSAVEGEKNPEWVNIQKKTFTRWTNTYLKERILKIEDIQTGLSDGVNLINLLEIISSKTIGRYNKNPKIKPQKYENIGLALKFLQTEGIKLVNIGPEDIESGKLKLILGLIWTIILRYQIHIEEGKSARNELLQWIREQIPEYDIKNFNTNWNDGRAICALANSLKPGLCANHRELDPNTALENATLGTDLAETDLEIPKVLDPQDMINPEVDELSMMTYLSYYRDWLNNQRKKMAADEYERLALANKSKAYGPGLEGGFAGHPTEFTIEGINGNGRRVNHGGDDFAVTIDGPSGPVEHQMTDNQDGTYRVDYTPAAVGTHTVVVTLRNEAIQGSPFTVRVIRAVPVAANSKAYGPGLEGAIVGQEAPFTIASFDAQGLPVKDGGDKYEVAVKGPYGNVPATVSDSQDGTYAVAYLPEDVGAHVIDVKLNGQHIQNSPFTVESSLSDTAANPAYTIAYGPGLEAGLTSFPAIFTIEVRDSHGNRVVDSTPVGVDVHNEQGANVAVELVDNKDGSHTATYLPIDPGTYKVNVVFRNKKSKANDTHIKDSPFTVQIGVGADSSKSVAFGPGVEGTGLDDQHPANFTVQTKDNRGNNMPVGGAPVEVKVTGPKGEIPAQVVDNGDGTYAAVYNPETAGDYKVDVAIDGRPLAKSPFHVHVASAGDAKFSVAFGPGLEEGNNDQTPAHFTIESRDRNGAKVPVGGDDFQVVVSGPNGVVESTLKDNGNGSYAVEYKPTDAGDHTVEVTLRDEPIKNSPFNVLIKAAGDASNSIAFGPGLEEGNDDQHTAHFTIQSINKNGTNVPVGGDDFKVTVHGPNGPVVTNMKDNGDGTYAVEYMPTDAGDHKIEVTLRDEPIQKSPFHVPIKAGADPSKTIAFGNGIDGTGLDDQNPAEFRVQTIDKNGNKLHYGGEPVNVKVVGPNGEDVPAQVVDNGDGTYDAVYNPENPGTHQVHVDIGDRPIAGSVFTVEVEEGIDEEQSQVEDYSFVIQAKNAKGEKLTKGGGSFKVSVKGPQGEPVESESRDLGNGEYLVSYRMDDPGEYLVTVRVNGRILKQFPTGIKSSY